MGFSIKQKRLSYATKKPFLSHKTAYLTKLGENHYILTHKFSILVSYISKSQHLHHLYILTRELPPKPRCHLACL